MTTLRVIVGGFAGMMILCVVMIFVTFPAKPRIVQKAAAHPCVCRCMRKGGTP